MSDLPPPSADLAVPRPDPNTYWVVPGRFLAGEYPFAHDPALAQAKLAAYLKAGINTFINLTHAHELEPYHVHLPADIVHVRIPVRDMDVPVDARHMVKILDTVDAALDAGRNVYVHCWGGIGRTGTVVACWLQRHGRSADEALNELAAHWTTVAKRDRARRSPETDAQVAWVRRWPRLSAALRSSPDANP